MTIELTPLIIALIAIVPAIFVFLAMTLRQKEFAGRVKKLENESLTLNTNILELEEEIVSYREREKILRKDPEIATLRTIHQQKKAV